MFSVEGRDLLRFVEWKPQSARLYLPERPADDLILSRNEFEVVGSVIKLERLFQRAEA
ncbi:MAG TPA: hypothetical protein VNQ79_06580 [Blastocatellia bacterium]|nr:hypothetical protein [Blastocatellia bacterium]